MKEFIEKVRKMREAQKVYFKSRCSWDLADAKHYEKIVDEYLRKFNDNNETELFNSI